MGKETLVVKGPKQAVEVLCLTGVRNLDVDVNRGLAAVEDAFRQATGEQEAIPAAVVLQRVEINACQ